MTVALSKSLTPVSRLDGSDGIGRLLHDRRGIYAQRQPRRQHVATIGVVNNHRPIQLTDRLAVAQSHPRFLLARHYQNWSQSISALITALTSWCNRHVFAV